MSTIERILATIVQLVERESFSHIVSLMSAAKSVWAYLLALTGGVFGLHHLYLGRTQHALLWLTTFGGFGLGILYEIFFQLNNYVREANEDKLLMQQYEKRIHERKSPAFELKRFCGQYVVAVFYGLVTYYAFPDSWHESRFLSLLIGFSTIAAIAFGTYLTGTLGPRQCSFIWPLLGAMFGLPFVLGNRDRSPPLNIAAFISSCIFEWKIDWDSEKLDSKTKRGRPSRLLKRCLIFAAGGVLFGLILTSVVCQNLHVDINGERVKVKDVLADFFRSQKFVQLYQQLFAVGKDLYTFYLRHGFKGIWTEIWTTLDSQTDQQAYDVLGLHLDASQKEIETQCRTLSRKWHPDRHRDAKEKRKAETTFMNIQQACDRLSDERQRRQYLNTRRRENPL